MNIYFYIAVESTLFCAAVLLLSLVAMPSRSARRMEEVTGCAVPVRHKTIIGRRFRRDLLRASRVLRAKLGLADDEELRQRFINAGMRNRDAMEVYFAARLFCPAAGIVLGSLVPVDTFFWIALFAGAGYLAPPFWLTHKIKRRRERIRRSVPDAIDLLVICVDAGLGLDQAMLRVGMELGASHPEINEEFLQINREQRAGEPRMAAWKSMADRTQLPDVAAFTSMLAQTERFGTPIAKALTTFADGIRQKRRQRAEEMAAKTTVKMIFPLVLFIFPSMFIVLLAPAVLSIARGLSGLSH